MPDEGAIRKTRLEDQGRETDLQETTPEQRVAMMWQLALDGYALRGEAIDESAFSRHVGRLVRGKC